LAGEDFSNAVTTVTEPTLILWGDSDMTAPLRTGRVLSARMPHARLEIIADSGHEPMRDQPGQTHALIKQHLLANEAELAAQYPHASARPAFTSQRVGTCLRESDMKFEGDYRSIDLRDCNNVTIRNVRVEHLNVINSRLNMIDTDIRGKDGGLHADNSDITITNGNVSGSVAIKSERSRFDMAGVQLKGIQDAVKAVDSKFVFSICRVHSPHTDGPLHIYKKISDGVL